MVMGLEHKCKDRFSRMSSWKVYRSLNQSENNPCLILHISSNVLPTKTRHFAICLSVCLSHFFRLLRTKTSKTP